MPYALRLLRASAVGAVLSVLWMFFVFGSVDPALGAEFSRLAWIGVARLLITLAIIHLLFGLKVWIDNSIDPYHPLWRRLARPFADFGRNLHQIFGARDGSIFKALSFLIVTVAFELVILMALVPPIKTAAAFVFNPTIFSVWVLWQLQAVGGHAFAEALSALLWIYGKGLVCG